MKKKCLVLIMAFLLLIYSPSIHIIYNCYADELINADILDQSEELPDEEVDDCPEEKYEGDSYPDFEVTIPEESGKTEDGVEEMPDLVEESAEYPDENLEESDDEYILEAEEDFTESDQEIESASLESRNAFSDENDQPQEEDEWAFGRLLELETSEKDLHKSISTYRGAYQQIRFQLKANDRQEAIKAGCLTEEQIPLITYEAYPVKNISEEFGEEEWVRNDIIDAGFLKIDGATLSIDGTKAVETGEDPISLRIIASLESQEIGEMYFTIHISDNAGICGDNLTWRTEGDVLIIEGSGDMYDYQNTDGESGMFAKAAPWGSISSSIKTIEIEEGVTSIGNYAFSESKNITDVTLPDSLKRIGEASFSNALKVSRFFIPPNVEEIGYYNWLGSEEVSVSPNNSFFSSEERTKDRHHTFAFRCINTYCVHCPPPEMI